MNLSWQQPGSVVGVSILTIRATATRSMLEFKVQDGLTRLTDQREPAPGPLVGPRARRCSSDRRRRPVQVSGILAGRGREMRSLTCGAMGVMERWYARRKDIDGSSAGRVASNLTSAVAAAELDSVAERRHRARGALATALQAEPSRSERDFPDPRHRIQHKAVRVGTEADVWLKSSVTGAVTSAEAGVSMKPTSRNVRTRVRSDSQLCSPVVCLRQSCASRPAVQARHQGQQSRQAKKQTGGDPVGAALSAVEAAFENQRIGRVQLRVAALCTLIQICDAFDVNAIAVTVPSLTHAWHLSGPAFTQAFVWSSVGILVGALSAGPIGDRLGRRPLLLGSVAVYGLASLLTAFVGWLPMLSVVRFFTGIGIGGALRQWIVVVLAFCAAGQAAIVQGWGMMWAGALIGLLGVPAGLLATS
jgi:hypothetical protein